MNWETFQEGLFVSGVGMGVVFVVLIVLQVTVVILGRFDRMTEAAPSDEPAASEPAPSAGSPATSQASTDVSPGVIAAIGAALALAEEELSPAVSSAHASARTVVVHPGNSWVQSGRARQMSSHSPGAVERRSL
ncbi:MAG: OadG family transporter subunit [Dehalococcoidia bacterium]